VEHDLRRRVRPPHRARDPPRDQHRPRSAGRVPGRGGARVTALLELDRVTSGYGKVEVLHDLSISVPEGSVVAVLGPNGAGKTTTLRLISGTLPCFSGSVHLAGERVDGRSAYEIARRGVTLVPEGRGIFPGLNVK